MNKKLKNALKSAYSIPEPLRKDEFLQDLEEDKNAVPFWINLMKYAAVPVTAAIAVVISTSFMNISKVQEQYVEKAPVPAKTTINTECLCEAVESEDLCTDNAADISHAETATSESTSSSAAMPVYADISAPITTSAGIQASSSVVTKITTVSKTTDVTTTTSTKTGTAVTTSKTTTTSMQTVPSPSTYTTMPTMTTANYEPSYTMPTSTTSDYGEDEPIDIGRDFTVYPETSFRIQDNIIDVSELIDFSYSPEPEPDDSVSSLSTWQYLAKHSDEAVYGIVVNRYYTAIDGLPYEQLDILVEYPLEYRNLYYGDMISVYVPSEYMSLEYFIEEYNCEYLFEDMTDEEIAGSTAYFPWTDAVSCYDGMDRLFFLNSNSGSAPVGAYRLTAGSVYSIFHEKGGNYICTADGSISFSMDEYNEFIGY